MVLWLQRALFWYLLPTIVNSSGQISVQSMTESQLFQTTEVNNLDSALSLSQQLQDALISLHPYTEDYQITDSAQLARSVSIQGNLQTILFSAQLQVLYPAELRISNATLHPGLFSSPPLYIRSEGVVRIEACVFEHFRSAPVLLLVSGRLEVGRSSFRDNIGTVVKVQGSGTDLRLAECIVVNHSDSFLVAETALGKAGNVTILLVQTLFRTNQAAKDQELLLFSSSFSKEVMNIALQSIQFEENSARLCTFKGTNINLQLQNSSFKRTSGSALYFSLQFSTIRISNSSFVLNSGILFEVSYLQGSLLVINSTVTQHGNEKLVSIYNSGDSSQCRFDIVGSSVTDSILKNGAFVSMSCQLALTDSLISRVVDLSEGLGGLFQLRFGGLSLLSVLMRNSGSSTMVINAQMSALLVTNTTLMNPISGQRVMVIAVLSQVHIEQSVISGGSIDVQNSGKLIGSTAIMNLSFFLSTVHIVNVTVKNQRIHQSAICLQASSQFNLTNIHVENIQGGVLMGMQNSTGSLTGFSVVNSMVDYYVVVTSSHSRLILEQMTLRDVNVGGVQLGCVLYSGRHSTMTVSMVNISNIAAVALLEGRQTQVDMKEVSVHRSNFTYLLSNILKSNLTVSGLRYEQSNGGLLFAIQADVRISDMFIRSISPGNLLFLGYGSSVMLQQVVLRDIIAYHGIAKFVEASNVTIIDSDFAAFGSSWGEGLKIEQSYITIINSSFSNFNVSLFQLHFSSIVLQSSTFLDGYSPAIFEGNRLAYGGVLGCLNCWDVRVEAVKVRNVSARMGGAFAVWNTETSNSLVVHIANSTFESCKANIGGALYISQAGIRVANCLFRYNVAERSGGAADITSSSTEALILHSTFKSNAALSGGGVHWHFAAVQLISTNFSYNSAYYGPDIASYGYTLSPKLPSELVSGFPFDISFEFRDHYNQLINMTISTELQLQASVQIAGAQVAVSKGGVFSFHGVRIYTKPGTSLPIRGVISEGNIVSTVQLSFRNCTAGETYKEDRCEYCYPGNVSFSPNDPHCSICPPNAFCPGGSAFSVNPHYWRISEVSSQVLPCPLKPYCLGGNNTNCETGYRGKLCTECEENWYRVRVRECEECPEAWLIAMQEALVLFLLCLFALAILKTSPPKQTSSGLIALKVGIGHAQMLSALAPLRIAYPSSIRQFLHITSFISSLSLSDLPLACLGASHPEYLKVYLASCVLLGLLCMYFLVCVALTKSWKQQVTVLVTSSLLFTPSLVVIVSVPLLACLHVDTAEKWLIVDMSERCWTGEHAKLVVGLVLPSLIINLLLALMLVFACLCCLSDSIRDKYFPIWVRGCGWSCWDILIVLYRVVCLCLVTILMAYSELIQITSLLSCIIVMEILTVSLRKWTYKSKKDLMLTLISSFLIALSALLAAYYINADPSHSVYKYTSGLAFVLLNSVFFLVCLYFVLVCSVVQESHMVSIPVTRDESNPELAVPNNSMAD